MASVRLLRPSGRSSGTEVRKLLTRDRPLKLKFLSIVVHPVKLSAARTLDGQ